MRLLKLKEHEKMCPLVKCCISRKMLLNRPFKECCLFTAPGKHLFKHPNHSLGICDKQWVLHGSSETCFVVQQACEHDVFAAELSGAVQSEPSLDFKQLLLVPQQAAWHNFTEEDHHDKTCIRKQLSKSRLLPYVWKRRMV